MKDSHSVDNDEGWNRYANYSDNNDGRNPFLFFNVEHIGGRSQFVRYNLKGQGINDDRFVEWIANQSSYNGLIQLNLDNNHLTAKSIRALGDSDIGIPYSISLANNPIGNEGAKALASASRFSGTMLLSLSNTNITTKGVGHLFGSGSAIGTLFHLDLSQNDLGDIGVATIAQYPGAKSLAELFLEDVGMTDLGAKALAGSPNLGNVTYLSVSGNKLTAAGVSSIKDSTNFADNASFYFGEAFE